MASQTESRNMLSMSLFFDSMIMQNLVGNFMHPIFSRIATVLFPSFRIVLGKCMDLEYLNALVHCQMYYSNIVAMNLSKH